MSKFCSVLAAIACVLSTGCRDDTPPPTEQRKSTEAVPKKPVMPEPAGKSAIIRRKGKESPCTGGKCLPVPLGIKGLTFGMSVKEAQAVVGKTKRQTPYSRRLSSKNFKCKQRKVVMPGSARSVKTTLGGERAVCRLDFADDKLSKIDCSLDAQRSADDHKVVVDALLASLWRRYGWETRSQKRNDLYNNEFRWTSDEATLRVRTRHRRRTRSQVAVENVSREHSRAFDRVAAEAVERCKAKLETSADAARRRQLEKEQELLKKSLRFEDDFLPPLEGSDSSQPPAE